MPGICLYAQSGVGPSNDPVQDAHALVIALSTSEPSADMYIELRLDSFLKEIQIVTAAEDSEVVSMHNELKIARLVGEATGRCPTLGKA